MTPEKRVENDIRSCFETAGGYITKIFASPNTNKGIPDLLGSLNGKFIALEIKRIDNGKPTPVQLKNLQQIANSKGYALVTNDDAIIKALSISTATNTNLETVCQKLKIPLITTSIDLCNLPSPTQAKNLWQQLPHKHTLQILPNSKESELK